MIKHAVEYVNYDPYLHTQFPILTSSKVISKNGIINLTINSNGIFNEIVDDIGYDNNGKYISITIGQWHHTVTGKYITNEEFYDLEEFEVYQYDYVFILIKIYAKGDYRSCFHNDYDKSVTISFIPYEMINFTN